MKLNKKIVAAVATAAVLGTIGAVSAVADTPNADNGSNFHPLAPTRVLDTRVTHQTFKPGQETVKLQITGSNGIPAGATAVEINLTATDDPDPKVGGHLTATPAGGDASKNSSVNYQPAPINTANDLVVKLSDDGAIEITNSHGTVNAVVDIEGYYTNDQAAPVQTTTVQTAKALAPTDPNLGTPLTHIGGPIGATDAATKLTEEVTLQPGTYQYTFYADFTRTATQTGPNTYGTAFLWADKNGDGTYDWQADDSEALGNTVQTGALPHVPKGDSIEQSANGSGVITVGRAPITVLVGGFAYNDDRSQTGVGNVGVLGANATFTKVNVAAS